MALITEANRRWWILVAMTGSLSMILLDQTIVSVALPSIQRDLDLTQTEVQWVVNAYLLAIASLVAVGGRLSTMFNAVRMFQIGVIVFAVGSAADRPGRRRDVDHRLPGPPGRRRGPDDPALGLAGDQHLPPGRARQGDGHLRRRLDGVPVAGAPDRRRADRGRLAAGVLGQRPGGHRDHPADGRREAAGGGGRRALRLVGRGHAGPGAGGAGAGAPAGLRLGLELAADASACWRSRRC